VLDLGSPQEVVFTEAGGTDDYRPIPMVPREESLMRTTSTKRYLLLGVFGMIGLLALCAIAVSLGEIWSPRAAEADGAARYEWKRVFWIDNRSGILVSQARLGAVQQGLADGKKPKDVVVEAPFPPELKKLLDQGWEIHRYATSELILRRRK
jgi:hypothetical protein